MINKKAVEKFLKRKLNSYDWLKQHSQQELDAEFASMQPQPNFGKSKLWIHQKVCFLLLNELKRFILFCDMGSGKSLVTLTLLRYRKQCGEKIKCIVFVPFITSVETWVEQVKEHCPDLQCQPLTGTKVQNLNYIQNVDADLFVISYPSAVAMCSKETKNKKGKTKWNFEAKEIRQYFSGFNMLVCDELHKAKNVSSLTYRMLRAISAQAEYVVGLTGTPFGRDLIDLWPQFYLIDFGETLGPTLGFYRDVFYTAKPGFFGGFDYKFNKKLFPTLKRAIQNCSISYGIDDLVDMPPKRYIKIKLSPTDESKGYCENTLKLLKEAVKAKAVNEAEQNYIKLRQLASGFMTLKGEDNEKFQIKFNDNPKLDALQEIIEGMPPDKKIVIFHHFVYTNQLISDRLKSMGVKHARIYGKSKDPIAELRKFKSEPDTRALVINSRSGSSSLNLQGANYLVFFEQPDSPIDRQQAERRVWRPGQNWKVFIFDLLMRNTADERLRASNKAGENLLKDLLNRRKEL
jgi:SNF2 family DNA or RNA helicase